MRQVRMNVFETNSSSTHSIAIIPEDLYKQWRDGEVYMNDCWSDKDKILGDKEWITKQEAIDYLKHYNEYDEEGDLDYTLMEAGIYSYDSWGEDYEHDCTHFTTPSGDKMVAECYYGWDC